MDAFRVAVSDVRLKAIIAPEAAVGERHPGRRGETKQVLLLYLEWQLVLVNIWSDVSLVSRPRVKKSLWSDSRSAFSLVGLPWRVGGRSELTSSYS